MEFEETWGVPLDRAATALDEHLQVTERGRVMLCVALSTALYFVDGETDPVRERIASVMELYRREVGDVFTWGGDPKTGRAKKVQGTTIVDLRSWLHKVGPDHDFNPAFQGGKQTGDASPYTFRALAQESTLCGLTFSVPLSWPVGRAPGAYVSMVLSACAALRPAHGYSGFGIVLPLTEHGGGPPMAYAAPLAARFRGVELDHTVLQAEGLGDDGVVKGVNWLTVLGDAFVEKLGGRKAIVSKLGTGIPVHTYEGGIVIQAGPHPRFGDVNRKEPMDEYERVAAVLKPIRATQLRPLAWMHGFGEDRTAEYLARFDR